MNVKLESSHQSNLFQASGLRLYDQICTYANAVSCLDVYEPTMLA
jgi:hypothetical protein